MQAKKKKMFCFHSETFLFLGKQITLLPQQMLRVRANEETFRETIVARQCFRNNVASFAVALRQTLSCEWPMECLSIKGYQALSE